MQAQTHGVLAPLLTPFNDDLSLAMDLYVDLAHRLLDDGCRGLVPFGTTGEALSVGIDERIDAIQALIDGGIDPGCLMPGTGVSNFTDTARLSRACLDMGCAAVMVLPPFYYKAVTDDGLFRYFAELIECIGPAARIFLYHIPPWPSLAYRRNLPPGFTSHFLNRLWVSRTVPVTGTIRAHCSASTGLPCIRAPNYR